MKRSSLLAMPSGCWLRRALLPALCCALLLPLAAPAGDRGFYVGAGVGSSNSSASAEDIGGRVTEATGVTVTSVSFDDSDTSWHLRAGYAVSDWLAFEAAYYDFGETSASLAASVADPTQFIADVSGVLPSSPHGIAVQGRLRWPFATNWAADFRAGPFRWESGQDAQLVGGGSIEADDDSTDFLWGVDITWRAGRNLEVGIEYNRTTLDDNIESIELAVAWSL